MREEYIEKVVPIPEGVTVTVSGEEVTVKHKKNVLTRNFPRLIINMDVQDNNFKTFAERPRKSQKAMIGTIAGHVSNMIKGVTEGYEYRLKIIYSHFPIDVKLKGNIVEITNMYGEKAKRIAKIVDGVKAKIEEEDIVITGIDKEACGQTAANIENATRLRGKRKKDQRIFQDGIYIFEKA